MRHTWSRLHLRTGAGLGAAMLALTLAGPGRAQSNATPVTLNFVNAEIDAVAQKIVAEASRKTGAILRG